MSLNQSLMYISCVVLLMHCFYVGVGVCHEWKNEIQDMSHEILGMCQTSDKSGINRNMPLFCMKWRLIEMNLKVGRKKKRWLFLLVYPKVLYMGHKYSRRNEAILYRYSL